MQVGICTPVLVLAVYYFLVLRCLAALSLLTHNPFLPRPTHDNLNSPSIVYGRRSRSWPRYRIEPWWGAMI